MRVSLLFIKYSPTRHALNMPFFLIKLKQNLCVTAAKKMWEETTSHATLKTVMNKLSLWSCFACLCILRNRFFTDTDLHRYQTHSHFSLHICHVVKHFMCHDKKGVLFMASRTHMLLSIQMIKRSIKKLFKEPLISKLQFCGLYSLCQ